MPFVDYCFYPDLRLKVLSSEKKKMKQAFDLGYADAKEVLPS